VGKGLPEAKKSHVTNPRSECLGHGSHLDSTSLRTLLCLIFSVYLIFTRHYSMYIYILIFPHHFNLQEKLAATRWFVRCRKECVPVRVKWGNGHAGESVCGAAPDGECVTPGRLIMRSGYQAIKISRYRALSKGMPRAYFYALFGPFPTPPQIKMKMKMKIPRSQSSLPSSCGTINRTQLYQIYQRSNRYNSSVPPKFRLTPTHPEAPRSNAYP
jgi:hypothetical protein